MNETEVFDEETFETILASATRIRGEIHESPTSNIRKAQDKQKEDFDRLHLSNSAIKVEYLVLLRNNKRKDRKERFHLHGLSLYCFQNYTQRSCNA